MVKLLSVSGVVSPITVIEIRPLREPAGIVRVPLAARYSLPSSALPSTVV